MSATRWFLPRGLLAAAATAEILAVAALPASANMRAPKVRPEPPSSALRRAGGGLVALGERLALDCTVDECRVEAAYRVRAPGAAAYAFEFILPARAAVTVQAAGETPAVELIPAEPDAMRAPPLTSEYGIALRPRPGTLYAARFTARLPAGESTIVVRYAQRTTAWEAKYGYFSKSRFLHALQYELWPLAEWALASDFALDLDVRLARPAPGLWTRWFGTPLALGCSVYGAAATAADGQAARRSVASARQEGERLVLTARLAAPVPDRLMCHIGDQDLLPE